MNKSDTALVIGAMLSAAAIFAYQTTLALLAVLISPLLLGNADMFDAFSIVGAILSGVEREPENHLTKHCASSNIDISNNYITNNYITNIVSEGNQNVYRAKKRTVQSKPAL